jgi:hypothetical protein
MRYTTQLSNSSLTAVKQLLGRTVVSIYAPCLQVAAQDFTAPSFSIPISDEIGGKWLHRYIIIRCEWYETPVTWTDYWQILVADELKPHGIEDDPQKGIVAPCTIKFYKAKPVNKIGIYSSARSAGEGNDFEEVEFDQAIRFWCEDGKSFCISCRINGPGIATEVHISEDEQTIEGFLKDSKSRLTLSGSG